MNRSGVPVWMEAIRPKTLVASIAPVVIGISLAISDGFFEFFPSIATLLAAILIQIGTNLANDYYDFVRGADNEDRIGPTRVSQAGLIDPKKIQYAMVFSLVLALLFGVYLVGIGGWVVAVIGSVSILCAVGYTAGPLAFAYNGLGDIFVFVFFGPVAVGGTYWVQSGMLAGDVVLAGVGIGALTTLILITNNMRDIETDKVAGKNTLAVRMGLKASRVEYVVLLIIALITPVIGATSFDWPGYWSVLVALLTFMFAISPLRLIMGSNDPKVLMLALPSTARMVGVYAASLSFGLLVG
ncbi:MAG TPA: 1,4-dihydroxy-2-naphthoate polyprenyltransferase [Gemmatimonadetes bacterium]|nr:1,4-dihydroxy-2-naphthoate polyprenyltransferase [Gemmatimonadota bacterium]